ncbi:MAG: hypothetical protein AB8G22_24095 [Saprospiraceae bacterium]
MFRIFLLHLCCLSGVLLLGQTDATVLQQLEVQLHQGEVRALRDVATFLENPQLKKQALRLLQSYTLLTPEEWDPRNSKAAQERFFKLYYQHENEWEFSPLLDAFYLTPLEFQDVKHVVKSGDTGEEIDIQLRFLIRDFRTAIQEKSVEKIKYKLQQIRNLQSKEANRFLLSLFEEPAFQNPKRPYYYLLMNEISALPHAENLQLVLNHLEEKKLSRLKAIAFLSRLTNVQAVENNTKQLTQRYRHLLDSLGSMAQLRQYGYNQTSRLRPSFFEHAVDYYGMVLSNAEPYPWIVKNAIQDVLQTEHPRALFYVAAQLFQFRNRPDWVYSITEIQEILQQQTGLHVAIENTKGVLRFDTDLNSDPIALSNYVTYWAAYYEDYEWDMLRKRFVNKNQAIAQTEVYESLFRRLNSANDSVAIASYLALTQGDPIEVLALAKKYKDLLRNYNKSLPSFKYSYLEQLVQLIHFCEQNSYSYTASPQVEQMIADLKTDLSPAERYQLENKLLESLHLAYVTTLEYQGIMGVNIRPFTFSVGRILDKFYAKKWSVIIQDEEQLRLYIKKAQLFRRMGTIGVCNAYYKKFTNASDDLKQRLAEMYKVETDLDVSKGIKKLIIKEDPIQRLNDFFDNPSSVSKEDLEELAPLPSEMYQTFVNTLLDSESITIEKYLLQYVGKHLSLEFVPFLIEILATNTQPQQVSKYLNKIYGFKKSPTEWLELWQSKGDNYQRWSRVFFNQQLEILKTQPSLTIREINNVAQSTHYDSTYRQLIISSLQKLKSTSQIRRLKIKPKLNLSSDLPFFENFAFSYKELDDIGRLFNIDQPKLLFGFMERKSADFTPTELGAFYNSLFRNNWFIEYVNNYQLTSNQSRDIQNILRTYLSESELISEFEERATIRNIVALNNLGWSLGARLLASTQMDAEPSSVAEIQEAMIGRITYEQIPIVIKYYDKLSEAYQYNFLNQDFGLPIFNLEDTKVQREIIRNHQRLRPDEFYWLYLTSFGVDFLTGSGELDYQKIYDILQFDIVTPFVDGGGNTRDYHTYGIIKLLEFIFDTRLGFHPKLNENQRFYSYSAAKRADEWQQFLVEKQLVQPATDEAPSFTKN